MRTVLLFTSLLVAVPSGATPPKPGFRAERYRVAHDALVPKTREVYLRSRTLQRELSRLRPDDDGRSNVKHAITVNRTQARTLREGLKVLRHGGTIGQAIRRLDREIKTRKRQMRKLRPSLWARLRGKAKARPDSAEKRRLAAEIEGLTLATDDLLGQATGLRGTQVIPELGAHILIPMVGMAGVRAGVQVNGSDTGRFPVRPYLRGQFSGNMGVLSVRGTAVGGAINGAYPSIGVQSVGGVEYSMRDPVAQSDKLSLRVLALQMGITRRGVEGGLGVPLLPVLFTGSVLVQNKAARKLSNKLRRSGFLKKFRAKSPTLDLALSDTPPSPAEIFQGFKAERAERKKARRARPRQAQRSR
jgi:hypothetical protein